MSTPDPLTIQVEAIRSATAHRLETAANAHALARSPLGSQQAARQTQEELHHLIRSVHQAKVFTVPEIAVLVHLSRSRVYEILNPKKDGTPAPTPAETRLPETDV